MCREGAGMGSPSSGTRVADNGTLGGEVLEVLLYLPVKPMEARRRRAFSSTTMTIFQTDYLGLSLRSR
jgi:hypothetical protein